MALAIARHVEQLVETWLARSLSDVRTLCMERRTFPAQDIAKLASVSYRAQPWHSRSHPAFMVATKLADTSRLPPLKENVRTSETSEDTGFVIAPERC